MLSLQVISCYCLSLTPPPPPPQRQISAAKFDTVIIGCHGGLLLTGDFHKGGHFPSFTITFHVAASKFQVSKNGACSVTRVEYVIKAHCPIHLLTRTS